MADDIEYKKKPWGIIAALVVVFILGFAGGYVPFHSTTAKTSTVHIVFYESLATSEANFVNDTLIPQFDAQHPGTTVTLVNVGSGDTSKDILALEQSGKVGPVVVGQDNLEIGQLIYSSSGNIMMNLTNVSSNMLPTTIIPAAKSMINYEKQVFGGVYFFPFRANIPLVFYNKTAFSQAGISTPPSNYTALLNDLHNIKSKTGKDALMIQGGSTNPPRGGSSTATELYQMMVQYGGNPLYANDTGDIHAFEMLYNLSDYFAPSYTTGYWGSYHGLAVGNYSILDYQWPYIYNQLTNTTTGYKMTNQTLGVYAGPNGSVNGNHLLGGDVLYIPKGATDVPQLESFITFLLGAQAQREYMIAMSWPAINLAAYVDLPAAESPVFLAESQAIQTGIFLRNPTPWITEWQTVLDEKAFNPLIVDHQGNTVANITAALSAVHSTMYTYIRENYGQANATLYNNPANYAPISV
ncbi:MAG: ABC transporter substrate-binding protein [Cuniculiplasma divulgatum]|jgi:trehalose transport system substrate-binding protein|nr:MAG: ABC transporter substrate-binding protein [Cuniculiplasma divulgatum]